MYTVTKMLLEVRLSKERAFLKISNRLFLGRQSPPTLTNMFDFLTNLVTVLYKKKFCVHLSYVIGLPIGYRIPITIITKFTSHRLQNDFCLGYQSPPTIE